MDVATPQDHRDEGEGRCAHCNLLPEEVHWRAMLYAPRDGTNVELLIEHQMWWTAHKCNTGNAHIWRASCEGHWIDHNAGGWCWYGMSGTPIGWRPITRVVADQAEPKAEQQRLDL